ncbi:uncharacterized protein LOC134235167, partial [Saccostrea cucullata]|uniref:uncharacterized protein LOC134235167 n=1 Tax=Saccostrea cuccullata TaxID=36930 RepID=UPI002ECFAFC6
MRAFLAALLVVFIIDTTTGDTIRIFDYRSSVQTWEQAREACRNLEFGQGWDLLQINDFENELITSLLRRECSDGTDGWWLRGTYSNFPGESNGDGRNNFAIYKNDFQSRSVAFRSARSSRLGYICEKQCGLDWPRTDGGSVAGTEEFGPSTSGRFGLTPFQRVRPSQDLKSLLLEDLIKPKNYQVFNFLILPSLEDQIVFNKLRYKEVSLLPLFPILEDSLVVQLLVIDCLLYFKVILH